MADLSVMKKAIEYIEQGKELAIVTITKAEGSTPRGKGSVMAVLEDGSIHGTIGGGSLEKHVIGLCLDAIKEGESKSVNLPLNTKGVEMVCGGEVEVFIDVYKVKPKLLIVGGGHVGYAIYKIASLLDFDITVFEDREEFLTKERFPLAKELVFGTAKETLKDYKIDDKSYIVIVTRGHKTDQESLEQVINSNAKYIGAMGSKRKIIIMMKNLKELGFSQENLNKLYAPIGLDIPAGSPEEIAMSIMSEVLLVKNNGNPQHSRFEVK